MYIPYLKIADEFDLKESDLLLIASDITRLAFSTIKNKEKFDGGNFIDSFQEKLSEGTLLFPAFVNDFSSGGVFNKKTTLPQMGILSKIAFEREDFYRNIDPVHSFLVSGKMEKEISAIHPISTFGEGSVFDFLFHHKAKMLLIDVDLQHSFTFAHYVEENQKVVYRKFSKVKYHFEDTQGKIQTEKLFVYSKKRGIINTLNNLETVFLERKVMVKKEINGSVFRLVDLAKAFEIIVEDIQQNKGRNIHKYNKKEYLKSTVKMLLRR